MRNKVLKKLLMIAMAVTMISGTSIATVYANANPPAEDVYKRQTTMYTDVNEKTGQIAAQVGQTPQGWNGSIYSMIPVSYTHLASGRGRTE